MGTRIFRGTVAKVLAWCVVACLVGVACSTAGSGTAPTTSASSTPTKTTPSGSTPSPSLVPAPGCLVGVTWSNVAQTERFDDPLAEQSITAAGGRYEAVDGRSSPSIQVTQIDHFVAEGAKVIIVQPATEADEATRLAIERAINSGVAVIAYEHFIESPRVLFIGFDEVEAGRVEARALLAAKPRGNYVITRFVQGTYWDQSHTAGIFEVLQPAVDRGDIKIVAEIDGEFWDWDLAGTRLAAVLKQNHNKVDAVTYEWHWAQGVHTSLQQAGLDGTVAVATQGDYEWNVNAIALGTETVAVWRDRRLMAKSAAEAAVALCKNPDVARLSDTRLFSSPGHNQIPSYLFAPQAITKDNLKAVIDSGWIKQDSACASVPPGKVAACP